MGFLIVQSDSKEEQHNSQLGDTNKSSIIAARTNGSGEQPVMQGINILWFTSFPFYAKPRSPMLLTLNA